MGRPRSTVLHRRAASTIGLGGISYYTRVVVLRIRDSALKHHCTREDISHAFDFALTWEVLVDEDPPRLLFIGADGAGNFLELIGCDLDGGDTLIWHAMPCRKQYLDLLPGQGGEL